MAVIEALLLETLLTLMAYYAMLMSRMRYAVYADLGLNKSQVDIPINSPGPI